MNNITYEQIIAIMPYSKKRAAAFIEPLNATIIEADLSNKLRLAMFLAQIAHESGELRYTLEIASGQAYEGRKDLGNNQPGDGVRFKGRGLIQVTGRANYTQCGKSLDLDCVNQPSLLESSLHATRSAGWFWTMKNLNFWADKGDFLTVTKKINGGTRGLAERIAYFDRALKVLPV